MEQLVSLISLGDGSTLTLDFTTGVLDSRLTFTRGSDATFINSQGFVQYAAVNYFRNTGWTSGTTPTGWNVTFGTGTTTWNADGTLTMTAGGSAVRPCINANSFAVAQGIPFTFGFRVTAVSGSPTIDQVISSTVAGETFSRNGATVSGSTVVQNGDIISCTFTPTTTSNAARMGPGVNVSVTNISITITQPQFNPGTTLQPYYANTSTIAARWDSARFDHDPTTLAPRGLLVEGQATNLMCWSESFAQSGGTNNWQTRENVTLGTLTTSPDNSTNAYPINETTTNGVHRQTTYFTTGLSGAYSWSIWAKCVDSGTPRRLYINAITALGVGALFDLTASGDLGTAVNVAGTAGNRAGTWVKYPNGWYRCTVVGTRAADGAMFLQINRSSSSTASDDSFAGSTNNGIIMWGSMLEAGSGASSYIPTGASTATRNPDNCSIHDTTTSGNLSWFKTATQGTFYVEAFKRTAGTTFAGAIIGTRANSGQDFMLYQAVGNNWLSLNWGASEYVTNYSTLSSPFLIKAAVAFSPRTGTPTVADSLVSINGANSALNTTPNVALPFSSDLFCVGARGSASGTVPSQNYAEVAIRRIKFFPTAMTAAQLNAMTTL
jgi:hypothetical protein